MNRIMQRAAQLVCAGAAAALASSTHAGLGGDTCNQPTIIAAEPGFFAVVVSDDNISYSDDYNVFESAPACVDGTFPPAGSVGRDVVYAIMTDSPQPETLIVQLNPEFLDLVLIVTTDCSDLAAGCVEASNTGGEGEAEAIEFTAQPNQIYWIIVDGFNGQTTPYNLDIVDPDKDFGLRALSDICEFSVGFNGPFTWTDDLSETGVNNDYDPYGAFSDGDDLVYRFSTQSDCRARVSIEGVDPGIYTLYAATDCADIVGSAVGGGLVVAVTTAENYGEITFDALAGVEYLLFVDTFSTEPPGGEFNLTVECTVACCLPGGCMDLEEADCLALGGTVLAGGLHCAAFPDSDGDTEPDVCDACPDDPDKIVPGECGCGEMDVLSGAMFDFTFSAGFNSPRDIALDASGRMYVADTNNHRIQVFSNAGTFLFEFGSLGSGDGQFDGPRGVAVDAMGRIYVADTRNERVQVFDNAGTFEFTIGSLGSNNGQFDRPRDVTVDAAGQIYVVDSNNHRIQVFDSSGAFSFTFGAQGGGDGQFDFVEGIAVDSDGRIYVADTFNRRIQVFDSAGTFLYTFGSSGSGDGQFNTPRGLEVDAVGRIYVADTVNDRIQIFDNVGTFLFTFGSSGSKIGQFDRPRDLAVDAAGRMYVADSFNNRVQVFDPVAECVGACCLPNGCGELRESECLALGGVFVGNGTLCADNDADGDGVRDECDQCPSDPDKITPGLCGCGEPDTLTDMASSDAFGSFGTGNGQFDDPNGVALDAAGRIYVADASNHRIQVFDNTGTFLFAFGSFGSGEGEFNFPRGVAVDVAGRIYVGDQQNHRIQVFDGSGSFLFSFGSFGSNNGEFDFPSGVAVDDSGRIHVVDVGNDRIQIFDNEGNFMTTFGSSGNGDGEFDIPLAIHVDADGQIFVGDVGNDRIQVFDSGGVFQFTFGTFGTGDGQFNGTTGVTTDTAGRIYVSDRTNDRVQVFNPAGGFLFTFGNFGRGFGSLDRPVGIAVDVEGLAYVADANNNRVQVYDPESNCCPADIAGSDGPFPDGVVNLFDLLLLIDHWGTGNAGAAISSEGGGSAVVDLFDLLDMLDAWGSCPCSSDDVCDDGFPSTLDRCIDDVCYNLSSVGPCTMKDDCFDDGDPCTESVCIEGQCYNIPISGGCR